MRRAEQVEVNRDALVAAVRTATKAGDGIRSGQLAVRFGISHQYVRQILREEPAVEHVRVNGDGWLWRVRPA